MSPSRDATRVCEWCEGAIPSRARRDSRTCSKRCRQAKHRFAIRGGVTPAAATAGRRFGYADPPYPGKAKRYYDCPEVDHAALIVRLIREFPDGWALSTSEDALRDVLALCPRGVRVAAWFRGSRPGVSWRPRSSWEPLIVFGGRPIRRTCNEALDDALVLNHRARMRSYPGRVVGMKSPAWCEWMFKQLGALPGDELVDLFHGSGAVKRAWQLYAGAR